MAEKENNESAKKPDAVKKDTGTLSNLLLHWSEEYEQGRDIPAEELCRDHPEHINELASLIALQKRANKFISWSDSGAGVPWLESSLNARLDSDETSLKPGDEPWPGYVLIERQGKGAFGEVWSARREGVLYALKIIRQSQGEHLKIEKEGLKQISGILHPYVLRRYWYWGRGKALFIITELADASLEQHFEKLRQTRPFLSLCAEAGWLLRDAAEALDYIMVEKNLMHLDIKPSNLLLVKGRCKLGDFGTVRPFSRSGEAEVFLSAPEEGNPDELETTPYRSLDDVPWELAFQRGATLYTVGVALTPHFASPERFIGKSSKSSDQYSLALTFCELVAGLIPFQAKKEDQLTERREGRMNLEFLPSALHPLIQRALAPKPEERFPSCLEFIRALREILLPLVDESEARQYLIDVREGGQWSGHGIEKTPTVSAKPADLDEKKPIASLPSHEGRLTSPQKSAKNLKKTGTVRIRLAEMLVAAVALTLAPWYILVHYLDRIGNLCRRVGKRTWESPDAWRGKVILFVLVIGLAIVPAVILTNWFDRLAPIFSRWFESAWPEPTSPEPKQQSPTNIEPEKHLAP